MTENRTTWERALDALDTTGGHLVILCGLFAAGVGMVAADLPKGDDVLVATFGAILAVLKTVHSSHTRYNKGGADGPE